MGYLTTYTSSTNTTVNSAITAVGTDNTPLASVAALESRDLFLDAPLNSLSSSDLYGPTLSPMASADFASTVVWFGLLPIDPIRKSIITTLFGQAHSLGIKARFYDTMTSPTFARDNVWQELLSDGEDWLNADDLPAAAAFYDSFHNGTSS